jgi:hypothetical protein
MIQAENGVKNGGIDVTIQPVNINTAPPSGSFLVPTEPPVDVVGDGVNIKALKF